MKPGWPTKIVKGKELEALNDLARSAKDILAGGITVADNMMACYETVVLPDGVETVVNNPLHPIKPVDIVAVNAELEGSATFAPVLKWYVRTQDGRLAITADYVTSPSNDPTVTIRIHGG